MARDVDFSRFRAALLETSTSSTDAKLDSLPLLSLSTIQQYLTQSIKAEKAQDTANFERTRSVVFGPRKHYSRRKLEDLAVADLDPKGDLRIDVIAKGKVLVCRIASNSPFRAAAIQFAVQDPAGRSALVHVYHVSSTYTLNEIAQIYQEHSVVAIQEPNIRYSSTAGYLIRIDSPSDIVPLVPSSPLFPPPTLWKPPLPLFPSVTSLKARANASFAKRRYQSALNDYLLASDLLDQQSDEKLRLVLLANAAAAYLALPKPKPGGALRIAQAVLSTLPIGTSSSLSPIHQKLLYRAAQAAYDLGRYPDAASLLSRLLDSTAESPDPSAEDLNRKLALRLVESQRGEYDWIHLFQCSLTSPSQPLDYAPFTSSLIKISASPSTGPASRGLFASAPIPKGTLLLVAKPLAHSSPALAKNLAKVVAANLFSESKDPTGMVELVAELCEKVQDDEEARKAIASLWDGEGGALRETSGPGIDVSRLEAIATFNAFHPESLAGQTFRKVEKDDEKDPQREEEGIDARSSLYAMPSYLNHSCCGNVTYSFLASSFFFLRARRDLAEGEELRDSYLDSMRGLEDRRETMAKHGFVCDCELCQADVRDGDAARRSRKALEDKDEDGSGNGNEDETLLLQRLEDIQETYPDSKGRGKARIASPALYRPLRGLSNHRAAKHDYEGSIAFEKRALEALGYDYAEGTVQVGDTNGVLSCLFMAKNYKALQQPGKSQEWITRAREIEKGQGGEALFLARYQAWGEMNGLEM